MTTTVTDPRIKSIKKELRQIWKNDPAGNPGRTKKLKKLLQAELSERAFSNFVEKYEIVD